MHVRLWNQIDVCNDCLRILQIDTIVPKLWALRKKYVSHWTWTIKNRFLTCFLVFDKCFTEGCLTDPLLVWISWDAVFVAVAALLVAYLAVSAHANVQSPNYMIVIIDNWNYWWLKTR